MSDLLITIAIPAYNNERTIQKTIDSCLAQETRIKYEVLIVDDASTDSTPVILSGYDDPKVRVVTLEERVPLIVNHNVCFQNALGRYVLFCHADDRLEDHAVETFANKLQQRSYPKKYIVWGHSMFRDFSAKAIRDAGFSYNEMVVGEFAPLMFLYGGLTPSGTCYSRNSFLETGGFLKTTMNAAPSDMTTMIYLAMRGFRFEMIDEMVLDRETSSTAVQSSDENIYLNELDNAFNYFLETIDTKEIAKLIAISSRQAVKPYYFYYTIARDKAQRKQIKKILYREILKKPWMLKSSLIQKIFKRIYS